MSLPQIECARCGRLAPVHPVLGIACPCVARDRERAARRSAARQGGRK